MQLKNMLPARYDRNLPAVKIIGKWGRNGNFARALSRTHSTTARWLDNGHIPGEYHGEVIAAARRDGIALTPGDFVDLRLWEKPA